MSAAEYLAWEREQAGKHELVDGEVLAMVGGSPRHNALSVNVASELRVALRPRGCSALSSDQRITFPPDRYVYPDATVVCGDPELRSDDVLANPAVLVEVLSRSTEEYDRGLKWVGYQKLGSLTDYLLVAQAEERVEHYRRNADGSWTYRSAGRGEHVVLTGDVAISVDAIYAGALALPGD